VEYINDIEEVFLFAFFNHRLELNESWKSCETFIKINFDNDKKPEPIFEKD
jgi:hypothetical protein